MKAETKKHFAKFRLLYITLLFFIIFPLGTLLIITAIYNIDAKKFKIKIAGTEVEHDGSTYKHFKDSSVQAFFDKFDIDYKRNILYYDNEDDKKNKHRPNGFGNDFTLNVKLKNIGSYDLSETSTTYVYGIYHFPGKKGKTETVEKNFVGNDKSVDFNGFKIHRIPPFHTPFIPTLKHQRTYFLFLIPFKDQPRLEEEELKQGKKLTGDDKRKFTDYEEIKFYIDFDVLKDDKLYKPQEAHEQGKEK